MNRSGEGDRWNLEWKSWSVPEQFLLSDVQLEVSDRRSDGWGFVVADDFYLSDDPMPHGIWTKPVTHVNVGSHNNNEEWPFFDLGQGARFVGSGIAGHRFYRLEFEVPDRDEDGIADGFDLCPDDPDAAQVDQNRSGVGDACDPCPDCEKCSLPGSHEREQPVQQHLST